MHAYVKVSMGIIALLCKCVRAHVCVCSCGREGTPYRFLPATPATVGFLHSLPNSGEVSHRPQNKGAPGSSEHLKFLNSQLLISRVSNSGVSDAMTRRGQEDG